MWGCFKRRSFELLLLLIAGWFCLHARQHSTVAFAQSVPHSLLESAFHILGTIDSPWNSMFKGVVVARDKVEFEGEGAKVGKKGGAYVTVPRGLVHFHSEHLDKTVTLDEKGFYQADLPLGFYKMTASEPRVLGASLTPYTRVFRVTEPATIVINAALQIEPTSCDGVFAGDTPEEQRESAKDACGGDDVTPIPAKDGTPFELFIRYPERQLERGGLRYKASAEMPVFVAYNLFSLQANEVFSNPKRPAYLTARGDVIVKDGSGKTQHLKDAYFRFQDGVAAQFREQLPRPQDLP